MRAWQDARIRKVVRRARGAEWRRAEALPGITLTGVSAEVRVFPPVPLDAVPKDLAKLQVTGTDFEDPDDLPDARRPILWINPGLTMSSGKAMAQCGHAAHLAWLALSAAGRKEWVAADFALAVRTATHAQWQQLLTSGLPVVQDAGFTEVEPGSRTVIADHRLLTR
jgi:peptidyl-tRNA hydrolase